MHFANNRHCSYRTACLLAAMVFPLLCTSCGPEDFQNSTQQFQSASTVVASTTQTFLNNMNIIEQNKALDDMFFQRKPLNMQELDKTQIISADEIKIRTDALNAFTQYTSNLAQLAQGKAGSAIGTDTTTLSGSLKTLAADAQKLPDSKATFINNPKFSGLLTGGANAVGAVAELMVSHRAKHEIEQSIQKNDAAITQLIEQIGDDAKAAHLRQQSQLGAYGSQLVKDYSTEIAGAPDPIQLLNLAGMIKNYRTQVSQLSQANPASAIAQLEKSHQALVAYLNSNNDPKTLSQFIAAVHDFVNAAQPLGQAAQALIAASRQ